jgi:hypothetical protein
VGWCTGFELRITFVRHVLYHLSQTYDPESKIFIEDLKL